MLKNWVFKLDMECLELYTYSAWEPPRTAVRSGRGAVERFLEDLGRVEDFCESPSSISRPEYEWLKRFVCSGDVEAVRDLPWDHAIAFATYYLIFHRRDLEAARRALELLKLRNLDEEEKAMLKILQTAYEAALNPPCGDPEALRRYAQSVRDVPELNERIWLLKTLVLMHLTDVDIKNFKEKIKQAFIEYGWFCEMWIRCVKGFIPIPKPFHHFAFYMADRARPLCPRSRPSAFEECLDERRSYRKAAEAALVPAAVAASALLLHKHALLLAVLAVLYATWTLLKLKSDEICIQRVWNETSLAMFVGNTASLAVGAVLAGTAGKSDPLLFASSAGIALAALAGYVVHIMLMPSEPPNVYFPKTGARDEHREYRRFFEDLADAENPCEGWLPYEHYNKLQALICRGNTKAAEKVSENWPLLFSAYYLMFHKRDIETTQKIFELLKSRNLDEKERAALEVLEAAYGAAVNPPCSNAEALLEKISGVQTYGWASLLKALVAAHFTCDPDYKNDVKRALLQAAVKCHCDNLSICYFTYRMLNRINLLCSCPV
jgi:hypothetical protein